ncbi:hypothetical protein C8J57DRAFT_1222690 [Mycena rebaudengoi]|nr:hypothetical protein C8J57DRAFT_1222690 [Mycena rebaudengoi]
MRSFFTATFLLGLLMHFALAVPVESDETVLTPFGYRLKSQVHELPTGGGVAHVGDEIHLLAENGTVLHVVSPSNATLLNPIPVGFEIASFRQTLIWLKLHLINQRVGSIQKFVLCTSTFISLQGPQKSEIVTILGTSH